MREFEMQLRKVPQGGGMTKLEIDAQLDNCCGPVPKPYVKPKLTGIDKEFKEAREARELWDELEKRV